MGEQLENKWIPKQGEKVLVKNHGEEYREREFIGITSEDKYLCWYEDKTNALPFIDIKPLKEEIKIGDWVKTLDLIFKVNEVHDLSYINYSEYEKITDKELIKKLNEITK